MNITIRKIAKDLNIAVSTVSKALRDSYEISEETKQKVLDYVREHDYIPNPYAGSLKNRSTKNIAVVLPEVADSFFSNAINGIDSVAQQKGYHVMVYLTHENMEREEAILLELRSGRVDGVLISVSVGEKKNDDVYKQLATELPLIFFDRVSDDIDTAKVVTDDFESSYNATRHLISRGCKELVFLSTSGNISIINRRRDGFIKALTETDIHIEDHNVVVCSENEAEALATIREILKRKKRVDGVLGSVEKLAIHVYTVCRELDLKIPKDVKVIGFSNLQIASLLDPPLTTIVQPAFEMGKAAATLLFQSLSRKTDITKERIVLPSVLSERDSTSAN